MIEITIGYISIENITYAHCLGHLLQDALNVSEFVYYDDYRIVLNHPNNITFVVWWHPVIMECSLASSFSEVVYFSTMKELEKIVEWMKMYD